MYLPCLWNIMITVEEQAERITWHDIKMYKAMKLASLEK